MTSSGGDPEPWREEEEAAPLGPAQAREYRTLAARANYLALDRPDIQFAVKESCRGMAAPVVGDRRKLKRLARYLLEVPRLVSTFPSQVRQGGPPASVTPTGPGVREPQGLRAVVRSWWDLTA